MGINDCTVFPGYKRKDGYAILGRGGKTLYAHRWYYELAYGAIPEGHQIDHVCRNRSCVNPLHLEAVTQAENVSRGMAPSAVTARTGICQYGHTMEGYNVITVKGGKRRCRACCQRRDRERYARKVGKA